MTQKMLLRRLGLSKDQFGDLLKKFAKFTDELDEAQWAAVQRSLPTLSHAVRTLGPDLTSEELIRLVREITGIIEQDDSDEGFFGAKILSANPTEI